MKPDLKIIINLILFLTFLPTNGFTQILNGIVSDNSSNPVPFASIGILNGHFGTVAKENGTFNTTSILSRRVQTFKRMVG